MKNIRNKNPKEYWSIIKKCSKTSIDIDDLYIYFGDLNKPPEISDEINSIVDIVIENLQPSNLNVHKLNEYIVSGNLKNYFF